MVSRDKIYINNVSSDTVGIYIDTPFLPPKAQRKTQSIVIPGRGEEVIVSDDDYEDVQVDISTYVFSDTFDMNPVYAWMRDARTLRTSKHSGWYYKVKNVLGVIPSYQGHGKSAITLSFVCSPYRYKIANQITKTEKSFTLNNSGNYYCKPVFKIFGTGDIKLTINNDENNIYVFGVNGHCIIDAEKQLVYTESGDILKTGGKTPYMVVGNNSVTITGNATRSEITLNERYL